MLVGLCIALSLLAVALGLPWATTRGDGAAAEDAAYLNPGSRLRGACARPRVAHDASKRRSRSSRTRRRRSRGWACRRTSGGTRRCTASRAPGIATVFPQAIGLAATFDAPLLHEMAVVIGNEGRAKHHQFVRQGKRGRYQGLTFWSPNINIFRDPRWGRGQETYGEDPYLTGAAGRGLREGPAGRRPALLPRERHRQALRGPQRPGAGPPPLRRPPERARPPRDLPARVPRRSWSRARSSP